MPRYVIDDDTIREIARLFHSGLGAKRISEQVAIPYATIEKIVAGKTQSAKRVLGGSLTNGKRRTSKQLAGAPFSSKGKKKRNVARTQRNETVIVPIQKAKPKSKPKRYTIFVWAAEWVHQDKKRRGELMGVEQ